ncbi:MAG: TetR/AcrR family transcriptional regulator [Myxococcales bacterium]
MAATRKPKERPYHHGDLKRALLETAEQMLQEDRHWQFTLREVARRAGVSHMAPYNHFQDKNALMAELAMVGFDRLRDALAARPRKPRAFREQFFDVGRAYVRFGEAHPNLYRLMFGQDVGRDMHLNARALGAFGVLLELLEEGQKEGVLRRRRLQSQAAACWAEVHGITMLVIDGLFVPEKVGQNAIEEALTALFEGLAI